MRKTPDQISKLRQKLYKTIDIWVTKRKSGLCSPQESAFCERQEQAARAALTKIKRKGKRPFWKA